MHTIKIYKKFEKFFLQTSLERNFDWQKVSLPCLKPFSFDISEILYYDFL